MNLQKDRLVDQHHLLQHKNKLHLLQELSKENRADIQQLKKKTETHELKLAPTSSNLPRSPWQLHSDFDTYPLFKSQHNKDSHLSKFRSLLDNLTLQGEDLQSI